MRFYFYSQAVENQASRGNPFSITRTRRCFFVIALRPRTHFVSRFAAQSPTYVLIKKWVLTFTTFQRCQNRLSQGALPNATAILRSQRR